MNISEADVHNALQKAKEQRKNGAGFSEIRKSLEKQEFSDEQIRKIITKVDDEELTRVCKESEKEKVFDRIIYAAGVFVFGVVATIYAHANANIEGGVYLVAYGPMFGGFAWLLREWRTYREL